MKEEILFQSFFSVYLLFGGHTPSAILGFMSFLIVDSLFVRFFEHLKSYQDKRGDQSET